MDTSALAELQALPKLRERLRLVDKRLDQSLDKADPQTKLAGQRAISGGKRLRPTLVIACGTGSNHKVASSDIIQAAAAVELLHIASLIHDDIIDNSLTRHDQPTINSKEGVNAAILLGDYLLAQSFYLASGQGATIAQILSDTFSKMCIGQSEELADRYNWDRNIEAYLRVVEYKTASLLASSCAIGGTMAGKSGQEVQALTEFGKYFGMSFQLIDDLLDLHSSGEQLKKSAQNDIKEGVYTLPVIYGLSSGRAKEIKNLLSDTSHAQSDLLVLLTKNGMIEKTFHLIKFYNHQATNALRDIAPSKTLAKLSKLPSIYLQFAKAKIL